MPATRSNQVGGSDYTSGANREDLKQGIRLVAADKTPFLSSIGSNVSKNTRHEWATDSLVSPDATAQSTSYQFDSTRTANHLATRISNYVQTYAAQIYIDGNQMKSMDVSAQRDWFAHTAQRRQLELRRNVELSFLQFDNFNAAATPANVYGTGDTPKVAPLIAYAGTFTGVATGTNQQVNIYDSTTAGGAANGTVVQSSTDYGTGGNAVWIRGATAVAAAGNGAIGSHAPRFVVTPTNAALTQAHINSTLQVASENGGMLNAVSVPTSLKTTVSNLLIAGNGGAAQRRASEMAVRLNLAVDSVLTDFGYDITIIHNYIQEGDTAGANSTLYFYNTESVKRSIMQDYKLIVDGTARYGKGGIVVCSETLEVGAANDVAVIAGATTT